MYGSDNWQHFGLNYNDSMDQLWLSASGVANGAGFPDPFALLSCGRSNISSCLKSLLETR
ncbi:Uncharacterised protein [Serratia grimesii]|nr:Uncharacterised protein [Serratia grimesii]